MKLRANGRQELEAKLPSDRPVFRILHVTCNTDGKKCPITSPGETSQDDLRRGILILVAITLRPVRLQRANA
jgi:hypothetical protein